MDTITERPGMIARQTFLFLVLATAAIGCSRATGLDLTAGSGDVAARVEGDQLIVHNGADEPVLVAVVERRFFQTALILWSFGGDEGTVIEPGAELTMRTGDIQGWDDGDEEAIVFWWHRRPGLAPEERAAAVRQFVIALR